jgi:hypothetical protein
MAVSDADLRQALLGTWRLVRFEADVDDARMQVFGDEPLGYLVYTADDHVFAQLSRRGERGWPGAELFELPPAKRLAVMGYVAYCGTFEVRMGRRSTTASSASFRAWRGRWNRGR